MPTSKSSTSKVDAQQEARRQQVLQLAAEGDHRTLLYELLAVIHRDGGQYTQLVGLTESFLDAEKEVVNARRKLTSLLFGSSPRGKRKNERTTP